VSNTTSQELVRTEDLLAEMEDLRAGKPIDAFLKESKELENMMNRLERAYDEREKVIDVVMKQGSGLESRKALRMFPTALLEKWAKELRSSRANK
jgi:hypothetical protein